MIILSKNYVIKSDGYQYILENMRIGANKDGEEKQFKKTLGYYPSLQAAVLGLVKHEQLKMVRDEDMTLNEAVERLNAKADEIKNLLLEV